MILQASTAIRIWQSACIQYFASFDLKKVCDTRPAETCANSLFRKILQVSPYVGIFCEQ
jgi:hypothetical protein